MFQFPQSSIDKMKVSQSFQLRMSDEYDYQNQQVPTVSPPDTPVSAWNNGMGWFELMDPETYQVFRVSSLPWKRLLYLFDWGKVYYIRYNNCFVCIEFLQLLTGTGTLDIDDVILNSGGVIIFTFLITRFKIIDYIKKIFYFDLKLNKKIAYFL